MQRKMLEMEDEELESKKNVSIFSNYINELLFKQKF